MDVRNVRKWCREFTAGRTEIHDEERSGRPSISDETVAKVEQIMRQDRRITLDDLCILVPEVSRSTIGRTLTEKLEYRKVCARWVPRMLTEDHQRQRNDSSRKFLQRYADENDNFLDSIVTGDKTWAFHFTPETKQQSHEWRHSSSPKPRKFKRTQSAGKVMATVFWDRKGVLLVDFMARGTTINADRYCETLKKTQTGDSEPEKRNADQGRMPSLPQRLPPCRPSNRCSPGSVWMGHHHPPTL